MGWFWRGYREDGGGFWGDLGSMLFDVEAEFGRVGLRGSRGMVRQCGVDWRGMPVHRVLALCACTSSPCPTSACSNGQGASHSPVEFEVIKLLRLSLSVILMPALGVGHNPKR